MLSCVQVQLHFKMNVSLKFKNRIRISVFSGFFITEHRVFCKPGKVEKTGFNPKIFFVEDTDLE
jgi:hypothetical protein